MLLHIITIIVLVKYYYNYYYLITITIFIRKLRIYYDCYRLYCERYNVDKG